MDASIGRRENIQDLKQLNGRQAETTQPLVVERDETRFQNESSHSVVSRVEVAALSTNHSSSNNGSGCMFWVN